MTCASACARETENKIAKAPSHYARLRDAIATVALRRLRFIVAGRYGIMPLVSPPLLPRRHYEIAMIRRQPRLMYLFSARRLTRRAAFSSRESAWSIADYINGALDDASLPLRRFLAPITGMPS